jgi:hypothetical protein
MARVVRIGEDLYALENQIGTAGTLRGNLVETTDPGGAYGGAYLCDARLFRAVDFKKADTLPTEHTGGFDLLATAGVRALKTVDIFDFYVDHLSGFEFYERVDPPEQTGGPWRIRWSNALHVFADGSGHFTAVPID